MPYYHVLLELNSENLWGDTEDFFETDLSQDDVEHIGRQYQEGSKVFFKGKWIDLIRIKRIEIRQTNKRAEEYAGWNTATYNIFYNKHGENVTRAFIISNSSRKKNQKSFCLHSAW
jgi:hypothetical protein